MTKELEKEEVCELCGGEGEITESYHNPADYHGYGEHTFKCECQLDNDEPENE